MGPVTDEMITAWLDGEATPASHAQIEAAIAASPELALRVARLSRVDRMLAPAFAETLRAPIPDRFEALFDRPPQKVGMLQGVKAAFAGLLAPRPLAMAAAALVVGAAVGATFLAASPAGPGIEAAVDGRMIANRDMALSLASLQSGGTDAASEMRIRLSLIDNAGRYCRQFETPGSAGLACLQDDQWVIDTLAPARPGVTQDGVYVMADGAPDPAIAAALSRVGVRETLDREQEVAAIAAGWK